MSQLPLSNRQRREQDRRRAPTDPGKPSAAPAPTKPAAARKPPSHHDGLKLLASKGKLTRRLLAAGLTYREAFILAAAEGVALRSCLELDRATPGFAPRARQPRLIMELQARQDLAQYRNDACAGLPELTTALDRICGQGMTLWEAAGGKQLAAVALEAQLLTALKLVAVWIERGEGEEAVGRPGMLGERGR